MTDRTMAPAADADITPFGMSCAGGKAAARWAGCRIGRIVASGPIAIITLSGGGLPACRPVSMSAGEKLDAPRPASYQIVSRGQCGHRAFMRLHGRAW